MQIKIEKVKTFLIEYETTTVGKLHFRLEIAKNEENQFFAILEEAENYKFHLTAETIWIDYSYILPEIPFPSFAVCLAEVLDVLKYYGLEMFTLKEIVRTIQLESKTGQSFKVEIAKDKHGRFSVLLSEMQLFRLRPTCEEKQIADEMLWVDRSHLLKALPTSFVSSDQALQAVFYALARQ